MDPAVDPVTEFLAALRDADSALASARAGLAGAGVPDTAFGRLFEAHDVRDAYHERLPGRPSPRPAGCTWVVDYDLPGRSSGPTSHERR
jgi:hypothetical protein